MVTTIMAVNEQERAKENKIYKDRRRKEETSRKEAEAVHEAQGKRDDDKQAEGREKMTSTDWKN